MSSRSLLKTLSRDGLVDRCLLLEQLLSQHNVSVPPADAQTHNCNNTSNNKKQKKKRPFDFSKYGRRKIALKVAYLGERYHGLAMQSSTNETVEAHLLTALLKTKLIEKDFASAEYSRSGRTDKGVSAFGQVVSLYVRSAFPPSTVFTTAPTTVSTTATTEDNHSGNNSAKKAKVITELNYVKMLNGVLPTDIRVLDWAPVDDDFNARFSCTARHYKYFFFSENMDIKAMETACSYIVGEHDFSNFCKIDVSNGMTLFRRTIYDAFVRPYKPTNASLPLYEFNVRGRGFLWHQVRCLMAVLELVGKGREDPEIFRDLVDMEAFPCKPVYTMASERPLVLYNCEYDTLHWTGQTATDIETIENTWMRSWKENTTTNALHDLFMDILSDVSVSDHSGKVWKDVRSSLPSTMEEREKRKYKPMRSRPVGESFSQRLRRYEQKMKEKEQEEENNQTTTTTTWEFLRRLRKLRQRWPGRRRTRPLRSILVS
eukprot:m.92735 g.92735  ORF g.92735 m.92735 type:complete len:486 (+) comp12366_c0_seq3:35-1492(+)